MGGLFGHNENPLQEEEWARIQETIVNVARRTLVGRRFIDLYGPLGAGVQTVPHDQFTGVDRGAIDMVGERDTDRIFPDKRTFKTIPLIYKDFVLHWRDLEAGREHKMPLDVSVAAGAAVFCAHKEDELIFYGDEELGVEGLCNCEGRSHVGLQDWSVSGNGYQNVIAATESLNKNDHYAPYALITSPNLYAQLHRVYGQTGVLEIETIRDLCQSGVHQSNVLKPDTAVVVSTGSENMDLAVAMDMTVAYLGAERMNHPFRVVESVLPRIKHSDAICTIG
jgi:uncharacterized linocin/CFP29 family protein